MLYLHFLDKDIIHHYTGLQVITREIQMKNDLFLKSTKLRMRSIYIYNTDVYNFEYNERE